MWRSGRIDGLSADKVLLNLIAQLAMLLMTFSLFFSPYLKAEYAQIYPGAPLPVRINDLVAYGHSYVAVSIIGYWFLTHRDHCGIW
jgi:hypothetical protein